MAILSVARIQDKVSETQFCECYGGENKTLYTKRKKENSLLCIGRGKEMWIGLFDTEIKSHSVVIVIIVVWLRNTTIA